MIKYTNIFYRFTDNKIWIKLVYISNVHGWFWVTMSILGELSYEYTRFKMHDTDNVIMEVIYNPDGVLIVTEPRLESDMTSLIEECILLKKQLKRTIKERDAYKLYVPESLLTLGDIARYQKA